MQNPNGNMSYEEARLILMPMIKEEQQPIRKQALINACTALAYRTPRKPLVNDYDERCCWMCGKPINEETICPHCGARIKYE